MSKFDISKKPAVTPHERGEENLIKSESDEALMRHTLFQCYSEGSKAFRVSKEHYRYLAEQIVSLREHIRRYIPALPRADGGGK